MVDERLALFPRRESCRLSPFQSCRGDDAAGCRGLTLGLDFMKRIKQRSNLDQEEPLFSGPHARAGIDHSSLKPTVLCALLVQEGIPTGV